MAKITKLYLLLCHRGGKEYYLPIGWKRFAVQVKGFYDAGALAAQLFLIIGEPQPSGLAA